MSKSAAAPQVSLTKKVTPEQQPNGAAGQAKATATRAIGGAKDRVADLRAKHSWFDHAVRAIQHYGNVQGTILAGAVTFFGFLSFFPILALTFAAVSFVVYWAPDSARDDVVGIVESAINSIFPGVVPPEQLDQLRDAGPTVESLGIAAVASAVVGVVTLLYSGLGWLSAQRGALRVVFGLSIEDQRNFVVGKATDVVVLGIIGGTLLVSVALSSIVTNLTQVLLGFVGLDGIPGVGFLLGLIGVALAIAASTALFYALFRILPGTQLRGRPLLEGAVVGALGFEVLKLAATLVIGQVTGNPLYSQFATMVVLLVWINYFARLVVLAGSWAATSPEAIAANRPRVIARVEPVTSKTRGGLGLMAAGAVLGSAITAAVTRRRKH